jgi:hypothetical protein
MAQLSQKCKMAYMVRIQRCRDGAPCEPLGQGFWDGEKAAIKLLRWAVLSGNLRKKGRATLTRMIGAVCVSFCMTAASLSSAEDGTKVYDGPYSAIAAGNSSWEIVGRHHKIEDARKAASEACGNYSDDGEPCLAITAGPNEEYFVAASCDDVPYTASNAESCTEAISALKGKASRNGHKSCNILACEQGGGGWPFGRY